MAYRFTKAEIEQKTIVQSREFDNAVGTFVDVINGGLDRDNTPENVLSITDTPSSTFATITMFDNIQADDSKLGRDQRYLGSAYNPYDYKVYGYRYGESPVYGGGGFVEATSQTITCQEGMLELSWHCSEMKTQYLSYWAGDNAGSKVALKHVQWSIRVDGNPVYYSPDQYEIMNTSIHKVNIPISQGNHTISVAWKVAKQRDDADQSQVILSFWGGSLVCINRYR